jgi:hypothetical protein
MTKRDTFIIGVDNAVKDNDLEALYEYAKNFDENDYPEEVAHQHLSYIWKAIISLEKLKTAANQE